MMWEYRVSVLGEVDKQEADLNFHGVFGWELVAVISGGPSGWPKAYFKRLKNERE